MSTEDAAISFDASSLETRKEYEAFLQQTLEKLRQLPAEADEERNRLSLDMAEAYNGLGDTGKAWELARIALDAFIATENWQDAVEACEVLYQTDEPASAVALSHGVWLSITYPVRPQTTVTMLNYLVDETPPKSDGAAVAAVTAHYIAGVRAEDHEYESLSFITKNILVKVAERHSDIKSQDQLDAWMMRMELNDPKDFLPRIGKVLEIVVMDQWWFDREELRSRLPVN